MQQLEEYEVRAVHFCLSSEADVRARSVLQITTADLYIQDRREKRFIVAPGGLLDPRLGLHSGSRECVTCGLPFIQCPGHWGHLELAEPMYNIGYLDRVLRVLHCVCFFCGQLLVCGSELERLPPEQRLGCAVKWIKGSSRKVVCAGCEKERVKLVRVRSKGILSVLFPEGGSDLLYGRDALRVLRLISDPVCQLLGLVQRPECMLFSAFPVPPLNIRPTSLSGRERRESELTLKLRLIVKHNLALLQAASSGSLFQHQKQREALQQSLHDYLSGEARAPAQAGAGDRKRAVESMSLHNRLKGKEGRMRGNLMGKRVDFSARTVITPDPGMEIDQVACPISICTTLTYPERVTLYNREKLTALVQAGPAHYPGANYVIRGDESRLDLRVAAGSGVQLQLGDRVERHLLPGDVVLMNRQPSLHRMSMMGHRIVPRRGKSFGIPLEVCTAYNADFDGDEMNMHVLQSEEARAETLETNMVYHHIINPKTCGPIIVLIQDAMLGIHLMTQPQVRLDARRLSLILAGLSSCSWPDLRQKREWSGRELFSFALPSGLYLYKKGEQDEGEEDLIIRDGQLESGVLSKREVNGREGIIRVIHKELGAAAAATFLNKAHTLANSWLAEYGASIGISDMLLDAQSERDCNKLRAQEESRLQAVKPRNEREAQQELAKSRQKFVDLARLHAQEHGNRIADTIRAGSKGEYLKLTQMSACVGTQEIRGMLLQVSENSGRSLCYAPQEGRDMLSYGFIQSSYVHGLGRGEYILHAAASLEGLMNTALSTSKTGYIQRRLVKAFEDIVVRYDGTVRRSDGAIISPRFGGHGMDPTLLQVQRFRMMDWSWKQLQRTHLWPRSQRTGVAVLEKERCDIIKLWRYATTHKTQFQRWSSQMAAAFHGVGLCWEAQQRYPSSQSVQAEEVASQVALLVTRLESHAKQQHTEGSLLLHQWLLLECMASKVIVKQWKLSQPALQWLLARVEHHFCTSFMSPGEAVGMITAQALGSDSTQMTLNTFHNCGESNITLGLPRLIEIVDASPTKRPSLILSLLPTQERPPDMRRQLEAFICLTAHVSVCSLIQEAQLLSMQDAVIQDELEIQTPYLLLESEEYEARLSTLVLRLVCEESVVGVALPMEQLVQRLQQLVGQEHHYLFAASDSNDRSRSVIHVRYLQRAAPSGKRGRCGGEKKAREKLERVRALFSHPKTMLLPLCQEEGAALLVDHRSGKSAQQDEDFGQELVLSSRALDSELLLLLRGTDPLQSYCNDFKVVAEVWGIEAAREVVRREAAKVFQYGGTDVLPAHIDLLVDVMTYSGELLGVTRSGVTKHQAVGPLMQCSFEVTASVLRDAAAAGVTDQLLGVSECIMMGRPPRVGSHMDISLLPLELDPSYSLLFQDMDDSLPPVSSPTYQPDWCCDGEEDVYSEAPAYTPLLTFDSIFRSLPHDKTVSTMAG